MLTDTESGIPTIEVDMKNGMYSGICILLAAIATVLISSCATKQEETVPEVVETKATLHELILTGYEGDARAMIVAADTENTSLVNSIDYDGNTPLHCAAMVNSPNMLSFLLNNGADPTIKNNSGDTPLHLSIKLENKDCASILWSLSDCLFATDANGMTALELAFKTRDLFYYTTLISKNTAEIRDSQGRTMVHYFAEWNDTEALTMCIDAGVNISQEDYNGNTPLSICYKNGKTLTSADSALKAIKNAQQLLLGNAMPLRNEYSYFEDCVKKHNPTMRFDDGQTPLHLAAIHGHTAIVRYLIERNALINAKDMSGATPLHNAVRYGDLDIASLLVQNGADVNAQDSIGKTPLLIITPAENRDAMYQLLLDNGASTRIKDLYGDTPLHIATITNMSPAILQRFVTYKADINERNKKGVTPLALAVENNWAEHISFYANLDADIHAEDMEGNTPLSLALQAGLETTKLLVSKKNIGTRDSFGNTPLHVAISHAVDPEVIRFLLDCGADVNARNRNGDTPLYIAVNTNNRTAGEMLLSRGADVFTNNTENYSPLKLAMIKGGEVQDWIFTSDVIKARDGIGNTPLHYAAEWKLDSAVQALIEKSADINAQNSTGESPLFSAVKADSPSTIYLLIAKGADQNIRDYLGNTALHACIRWNAKDAAMMLIRNGADPNAQNVSGKTPLHEAAKTSKVPLITLLLNNNADINAADITGRTVLMDAIQSENIELVELLIQNKANVFIQEMYGRNAYHEAVETGNSALISIIKKAGGQATFRDSYGRSPLSLALNHGGEIIQTVLGDDLNLSDSDGNTPVHIAIQNHVSPETLTMLISMGYPVDRRNSEGKTPLILAVQLNQVVLANTLIQNKADPFVTDNSGTCALTLVLDGGNQEILNAMVQSSGNRKDVSGDTILHYAARIADDVTIKRLINMGMDRTVRNISGETAYATAQRWQRPSAVQEALK